jgi:hypothetical protein
MRLVSMSKLHPLDWLAILPAIAVLVGHVVDALRDGRLEEDEIKRLGNELVAIVGTVAGKAQS